MTKTPREQILTEAAGLITGDRNKSYGAPTQNFANTAALWNVQIGHKLKEPLTATDVAQLMTQLKMARMIAQPMRDNYADAIGYLACGWECEETAEPGASIAPSVRYWLDEDGYYYRWDGTELTYVFHENGHRHESANDPADYLAGDGDDDARETPFADVPVWAR